MKASRIHYFFAENWPAKIWLTAFLVVFLLGSVHIFWPLLAFSTKWTDLLLFFGYVLLAVPLGWCIGILSGCFVIGPLNYYRSLKNGEPFHQGDTVQILTGPHRDRIVRVVSVFDIGYYAGAHRVRVDLGETGEAGEDVFESTEVLRVLSELSENASDRKLQMPQSLPQADPGSSP
jgi:hypothetical protein